MTLHEMTERAVSKGFNRDEAVARLHEAFAKHAGDNLAYYLVYWGFATSKKANAIAAEHAAMLARI
jgi:class 3 adenylate cyclase